MVEVEVKEYLHKLCDRINQRNANDNVIYIKSSDEYIKQFLESEHAQYMEKRACGYGTVYLPRYNANFKLVLCGDNARGYKPRKVLIDSRLPIDLIQCIVEPSLIVCSQCGWF